MSPDPAEAFLLDVNVLIALTNPDHEHFLRAHRWFSGVRDWATCPITESGFVRLMLNPAVAGRKRAASDVLATLRALRALPGHQFWADDVSVAEPVIDLIALASHRDVTDFHLVDLAARRGATLATLDAGISPSLVRADQRHVTVI